MSEGFYHPDEQYYALDFAFIKLGILNNPDWSWEYLAQIRPWLLPFFYYCFGFVGKSFGMENPFSFALMFRIITMLIGFYSHVVLIKHLTRKIHVQEQLRVISYFLLFSWPIIYMHARTSSDGIVTSLFILTWVWWENKNQRFLQSIVLVLLFYLRFQLVLIILPLVFLNLKDFRKNFLFLTFGALLGFSLGTLCDYWGYGELVLTPWNYFFVNIIEKKASSFGESGFGFYGYKTISKLLPFWGLGVVWVTGLYSYKFFKSKFDYWMRIFVLCLPFLIVHHYIGHKELRFLYPILPFFLILLGKSVYELRNGKKIFNFIMVSNLIVLPFLWKPAYSPINIYKFLWNNPPLDNRIFHFSSKNPLEMKVYLKKGIQLVQRNINTDYKGTYLTQNFRDLSKLKNCEIEYSTYPKWVLKFNFFNWVSRSNVWAVSKCN